MCGIVGYKGNNKAIPVLIAGLKALEYRGYDSSGIAYYSNKNIVLKKCIGSIDNLEKIVNFNEESNIGIGHTRWATHGKVTENNAHPHKVNKITLVHNGIIENYDYLRNLLLEKGYSFKGETDSEVLCAYIDYKYKDLKDILKTLSEVQKDIIGSYAICLLCEDEPNTLYAMRYNSPLIVACKDNEYYLASDVPAIIDYTNKYYLLDQKEIVKISDKLEFYNANLDILNKNVVTYDSFTKDSGKGSYKHFMLKEIHENPEIVKRIIDYYLTDGKFNDKMPSLKKYNKIYIVGCGSASYTGKIAKFLYEEYLNIPVEVFLASEYRYQKLFYDKNTLVIFISQSGETADTLEALRRTKEDRIDTLAIVNAPNSSIGRLADITLDIRAGAEVAVATTKAFTGQLLLLVLILIKMANKEDKIKYFYLLETEMRNILARDYLKYAEKVFSKDKAFFIGRGIDYGICEEGSLKLKEISYINASAFPAGELKHGTISLIENETPVIGIISDENLASKTISNLKEVKARGAYVLCITSLNLEGDFYDDIIKLSDIDKFVNSSLIVIVLQLIAYYVADLKGESIDKPRNLAKSVTVE